jgi:pantoate--beta-alanine ligase
MAAPRVVTDGSVLREIVRSVSREGRTVGLVPTMGALHEGHLSLVRRSVAECAFTVATIFVNPTQFGPREDFAHYPRNLESDVAALARERTDAVFTPTPDQMYGEGFSTFVQPPAVARPFEGRSRPDQFRGVATVVLKLFNLIPADVAYFGQKDYQQFRVIQDMARDLDLPVRVEVCPIIREPDGLAMSSRNRYLDATERRRARALFLCLERAAQLAQQGERDAATIRGHMRSQLETAGITRIDYVALVDPVSLDEVHEVKDNTMALVAAYVGGTRLIDNRRIG